MFVLLHFYANGTNTAVSKRTWVDVVEIASLTLACKKKKKSPGPFDFKEILNIFRWQNTRLGMCFERLYKLRSHQMQKMVGFPVGSPLVLTNAHFNA